MRALFDELHDRGRRVRLARRADLEQRAGIYREWFVQVGNTMEGDVRLRANRHSDCDARHVQPGGDFRHFLLEFRLGWHHGSPRHRSLEPSRYCCATSSR